jgi:hypothetical protein
VHFIETWIAPKQLKLAKSEASPPNAQKSPQPAYRLRPRPVRIQPVEQPSPASTNPPVIAPAEIRSPAIVPRTPSPAPTVLDIDDLEQATSSFSTSLYISNGVNASVEHGGAGPGPQTIANRLELPILDDSSDNPFSASYTLWLAWISYLFIVWNAWYNLTIHVCHV